MLSTFNFRAYLSIFLMMVFFIAIFILMMVAVELFVNSLQILIFAVFNAIIIFLIINELRNKIVSILIINNQLTKSSYFAQDKIYYFKEFDGFQVKTIKGKFKDYECLYLLKNGTKVITLSEMYHENYKELKAAIAENSTQIDTVKAACNSTFPTGKSSLVKSFLLLIC